jgi:hypothetical protein
MRKLPSSVLLFLMSLPALAATQEMAGGSAPPETVDTVYVVIFGIVFIGMIAGFAVYMLKGGKDEKPDK